MKNIHITELMSQRNTPQFPMKTSVKDLLKSLSESWKINHFYITDQEGYLVGLITKKQLLDYLCPIFLTADMFYSESLDQRLEKVEAYSLIETSAPFLTLNQSLPDILELFAISDYPSLPVVDNKGKLVGEVVNDALFKSLLVNIMGCSYAVS